MKNAVLFDFGGTLVYYFNRPEFPEILKQGIIEVQDYLGKEGLLDISPETMWQRVRDEDHEAEDYRVRPLEERLIRIFQLDEKVRSSGHIMEMCRRFMRPIFARGYRYEETLPTLERLKSKGVMSAIVSNTTWGSPAFLWREEIERFGLTEYMETVVFCRDVGWRKPAPQIFAHTLKKLQASPQNCLFVGDTPKWDFEGPKAFGMDAILIDRRGVIKDFPQDTIKTLGEILERL
jgi:putative hydrolase of the HAD superfamily